MPQQLRYAGYWYDNELAWYWLTVRSYDPALERFLEPDPSEIEGLFNYIYAGDNPADRIDPSGLSTAASRSRAVPLPPQVGNLLTAHGNIESNVQVGSAQWNNEIGGGGAKPFGALQGSLDALEGALVPLVCATIPLLCQSNLRASRAGMAVAAAAAAAHVAGEGGGEDIPEGDFNLGLWLDAELPAFATEEDVANLIKDTNQFNKKGSLGFKGKWQLTVKNARRAFGSSPPGTTRVVVAGPGGPGGDVQFFNDDYSTTRPVLRREIKALEPGNGKLKASISEGADAVYENGEVWIQVRAPEGGPTLENQSAVAGQVNRAIKGFENTPGRIPGDYRNVRVTIFDQYGDIYKWNYQLYSGV